jgi:hypothetical protein
MEKGIRAARTHFPNRIDDLQGIASMSGCPVLKVSPGTAGSQELAVIRIAQILMR